MATKRNDKTGAKRGAGPYSRSYYETTDKPAPGMAKHYPEPEGPWRSFYKTPGAASSVQDLIAGKDISRKVLRDVNNGFSGPVSGNKRPAHKQGSWKRV
jgi:hypothetical protein